MINEKYIVYMHKNKINDKVYIGVTKDKKKRFGKNGINYKQQPFYKAIQKYGWNNFEHIILFENLNLHDAELKEIELISCYKANNKNFGYNVKEGGITAKKIKTKKYIHMKVQPEIKEQLINEARQKGLSLNSYIRMIILGREK